MSDRYLSADVIAAGLGGRQSNGKCFCPAHDDRNTANLGVDDGPNGPLVKCWAGCRQDDIIAALQSKGLWRQKETSGFTPRRKRQKFDDKPDEFERELKGWHILRAASKEKPTAYLQGRGIKIVPSNVMILSASDADRLTGKRYPAMVFPIMNERHLPGAHLTWLCKDASAKLAVHDGNPKRMYGRAKGGFVILAPVDPDRAMIVGEGVETVLSAMQLTGLPGVAALSADGLKALSPPPCSEIIIATDHDGPGRGAADALAQRLGDSQRFVSRSPSRRTAPRRNRRRVMTGTMR